MSHQHHVRTHWLPSVPLPSQATMHGQWHPVSVRFYLNHHAALSFSKRQQAEQLRPVQRSRRHMNQLSQACTAHRERSSGCTSVLCFYSRKSCSIRGADCQPQSPSLNSTDWHQASRVSKLLWKPNQRVQVSTAVQVRNAGGLKNLLQLHLPPGPLRQGEAAHGRGSRRGETAWWGTWALPHLGLWN